MAAVVTIYYVTIGNSDDKLTQRRWSAYCHSVDLVVRRAANVVHGYWLSETSTQWQNACWCIDVYQARVVPELKDELTDIAAVYEQDAIAWVKAASLEYLRPGV